MPSVLILGAASDMAIAIAKKYASENYQVLLAARNVNRLEALQADMNIRSNAKCTLHEFDATRFETHQSFWDSLPVKPSITICVFGYLGDQEKAMTEWKESEKIIHANYTGAVSILNVVAQAYIQQKSGVIVGISSVAGERGRQSNYIYGSAKAGFTAYLAGLRNRLFHHGVHVVSVQPGFVNTQMTAHLQLPGILTAEPKEVADAIYKAVVNKKNTIYVRWFWRYIMLIIKIVPEFIFKKMKM